VIGTDGADEIVARSRAAHVAVRPDAPTSTTTTTTTVTVTTSAVGREVAG
jgi:hypothetical protein